MMILRRVCGRWLAGECRIHCNDVRSSWQCMLTICSMGVELQHGVFEG
jgi:hypothetical protein